MSNAEPLKLTPKQREQLEQILAMRTARAGHVRRVRIVLLSADGVSNVEIAKRVGITVPQVSRIRARFIEGGVPGLADQPKAGRKDHAVPPDVIEQIVALVMSPPPKGYARWSTRMVGARFRLSSPTICKILAANDLKPHLEATFKVSKDPAFAEKVRDVVGLYLAPPEQAVVLSVDEKTQIQALERTQPLLPLRPGSVRRRTHDYKRNGVVDLYAALNVGTGEVTHRCTERHTAKDFLGFMNQIVRAYPKDALHVILDNSSTHSTPDVKAWLAEHPRVSFHYTPTSASWLNQVETLFSILTRQSLRRSDFPSKSALKHHIRSFLAAWNQAPRPFVWTKDPQRIVRDHRKMLARI
jgi:transposase